MNWYSKMSPDTAEKIRDNGQTIFIRTKHQDQFYVPRKYFKDDQSYNAQFKDAYKFYVFPKGIAPTWLTIYNSIELFPELPEGVM